MVVALRAAEADAEQAAADRFVNPLRAIPHGEVEGRRAGRVGISRSREDGTRELIERCILAKLSPQPGLERSTGVPGRRQRPRPQSRIVLGECEPARATHDRNVISAIACVTRQQRSDVHRLTRRPRNAIVPMSGMLIISR